MKIIARLLFVTALASGVGCARTDWIDRTLVTEGVTGVWRSERNEAPLGTSAYQVSRIIPTRPRASAG